MHVCVCECMCVCVCEGLCVNVIHAMMMVESQFRRLCFQQQLLMEKLEEAIADFQKSIILSPDFPTSYVQKAFAGTSSLSAGV